MHKKFNKPRLTQNPLQNYPSLIVTAPAVLLNETPPVSETCGQFQGDRNTISQVWRTWKMFHGQHITPPQINNRILHVVCPTCSLSAISEPPTLFPDQAKSVAMIWHAMDVIKANINHLNPGQVPVIAMDLPLYAAVMESWSLSSCLADSIWKWHFWKPLAGGQMIVDRQPHWWKLMLPQLEQQSHSLKLQA